MKQSHVFDFELNGKTFGVGVAVGEDATHADMSHDARMQCLGNVFLVEIDNEMLSVVGAYLESGVVDEHGA